MKKQFIYVFCMVILSCSAVAQTVRYPNLSGFGTESLGLAVLKLALEKSGQDFQVEVDAFSVTANRVKLMLEQGDIDVLDGGYSPAEAAKFQLIYLPIDMGLSGWRVFVTRPEVAAQLAKVRTIDELRAFTFGQGQGWNDVNILQHAGFKVVTTAKFDNLLTMLSVERFDLLPLGANEAYRILALKGELAASLVVDKSLTLVYPFGRFFYVRKEQQALAAAIRSGMEKARQDGSLMALLKVHPFSRDVFDKAHLQQRTVIRIDTPEQSDEFKAIDKKWWFTPHD